MNLEAVFEIFRNWIHIGRRANSLDDARELLNTYEYRYWRKRNPNLTKLVEAFLMQDSTEKETNIY